MFAFMAKNQQSFAICANCVYFVCIIVLFDAFNKTQSGEEIARNIFSRLMKYFCVVMLRVDRPDPAQFQKINFVG